MRPGNKGVALISTLIMVGIAATIMAKILVNEDFYLNSARKSSISHQLSLYQLSMEDIVRAVLVLDSKDNKVDHKNEFWATSFSYPLDDTVVANASLEDLHYSLNLNNIRNFDVKVDTESARKPNWLSANLIAKTLEDAGIPKPWDKVYTLIDWIDTNDEVMSSDLGQGAESNDYLFLPVPYRVPNELLVSPYELNLLKDFDKPSGEGQTTADILASNFVILPSNTKINVNSIRCDSRILEVLFRQSTNKSDFTGALCIPKQEVDYMAGEEYSGPYYKTVQEFYDSIQKEGGIPPDSFADWKSIVPMEMFTVVSNFFLLRVNFFIDGCGYTFKSLIHRRDGAKNMNEVKVLRRWLDSEECN